LCCAAASCSAQSTSQRATTSAQAADQAPVTATADDRILSQQTPPATATGPATAPPPQSSDQSQGKAKADQPKDDKNKEGTAPADATSKDRLFFALPNFATLENAGQVPPMTAGQKFKLAARSSFDPVQVPWYGFLAGISQAEDSEDGYGQGAAGYGKRFGAYAADGTIENLMVGAVLPSLFRQDPRFFQSGKGSFAHRSWYAVSRIVVTRSDSGHQQFNVSEILGSALAASISTYSYHPREDRKIPNTASVWASQVGYDTITLMVKEFWPDIRRKLKKQPH
jgi:hypothetical protein